MNLRQERILQAIIDSFLKTASPIGSHYLYEAYDFDVSPATIRNDMTALEDEGLIYQPHTSAGRVPTGHAYRAFVDRLSVDAGTTRRVHREVTDAYLRHHLKKLKERLFDLVAVLAEVTGEISFATLPDKKRVFYIGVGRALRQPEFMEFPERASRVIEVLENDLYELLQELEIQDEVIVSIGEENLISAMRTCSLLAIRYEDHGYSGIMGILGPTRMNYAYNIAALKEILRLLQ
ncbi:DeoR family transcriptional regulator [Candidatus Peregrinibacteria bacterium]|nr:DeoR family transcriptional regulator [Candidatus Peregrinibacteria bacterium]